MTADSAGTSVQAAQIEAIWSLKSRLQSCNSHRMAGKDVELPEETAMDREERHLRVVAFAGASNWPIWVAQTKNTFAREGLEVTLEITPSSKQMAVDVFDGKYDIALTAIDNVVAYVEGQGEAELSGPADFAAFMGIDDGMLSLMAIEGVSSVGDLRGKEISVDAMTTGFAFVLREALAKSSVRLDEVNLVAVGGGAQRLAALREKKQAATLLNAPLDLIAEDAGAVRLADMRALIGPYQGIVGMARRSWLSQNRDVAVRFVRALLATISWLTNAVNKAEAIEVLHERLPATSPALAERIYTRLTDPQHGIRRDAAIDLNGLATVLRLRSSYSNSERVLDDPARYIDLSVRHAALMREIAPE
jgi:ABC-type nitrate/sulfonate/bicarbonate transport system substrate-binding protein